VDSGAVAGADIADNGKITPPTFGSVRE